MTANESTVSNAGLKYQVNDKPGIGKSIILGFQNILTSFGGIVAVPLSIAGIAGLDIADTAYIVSAALLVSGIASIIQSKGFGSKNYRIGIGLPTVMGTDFGFVPAANVVISSMGGGLPAYFGGSILGAILEFILSHFVEPLMKIFTPIITGTVITLMGLSMMPVAFDWIGGGFGNPNYGDPTYLAIAVVVLLVVLFLNRYGKGMVSSASVLIGMVAGYIISIPFGLVNFPQVAEAAWFKLPEIGRFGISFNIKYAIPFIAGYLVTIIETVGVMQTLGEVTGTELTGKDMAAGVRADAVGSMIGPLLGSGPVQSFSQNVGLIPLTKCGSRFIAIVTGVLLIFISFCPKFATLISIMPECVLGGASIVMFGTVAVSGIKTISKARYTNRNMLIVASALGIGLGVTFRPDILAQLPGILSSLFSSGLSAGTIVALVLSAILKEEDESEPELN